MKGILKSTLAVCLALIMACSCFSAGFTGYAATPETTSNDVGFVYPTSMTAKMARPLYIGLDSTVKTDSTYGEWNYFDPDKISNYVEVTVTFSDGQTKTFDIFSNDLQSYSRYGNPVRINFGDAKINIAEAPLEAGKTYTVPISATLNYRYPYVVELESTIEVEVASASVTGIKAEASHAIPYEVGYCDGTDIFDFKATEPKISLTLSDGGSLPLYIDKNENNYQLYGQYIYTSSDQDENNHWQLGENHEFSVWFGREDDINQSLFATTMPVTVESFGKINSVEATVNSSFYESITGAYYEYQDRFEHHISYMDIDFKISFENGHNVTVKGFNDEFWAYGINVYDDTANNWKAGNTYPIEIEKSYYDAQQNRYTPYTVGTFNLNVLENPIETLEVITTGPAHTGEAWQDTDANGSPYTHYRVHESFCFYNITFKDGRPALNYASLHEVSRALGGVAITTDDQRKNHWQLGKNTATALIGGTPYQYEIWVTTDYIKDIRVKDGVEVIEGMFASEEYDWDKPYGEQIYYKYQQYLLSAELEVELYDGTIITEYTGAKKYAITETKPRNYLSTSWSGDKLTQTAEDHWEVGDTFNLTLTANVSSHDNTTKNQYKITVPITVKANDTAFDFGYCYEDPNYSYGLGLSISGIKSAPADNILKIPSEAYGYKIKKIDSLNSSDYTHYDIKEVHLPDTVKAISDYALEGLWYLEYIDLNMVEELGASSLIDCSNDLKVVINPNNKAICYKNGVIYNKDVTEIKSITGATTSPIIEPTVKTVHNTDIVYYRYEDITITGMDTHLKMVESQYGEPDPFPTVRCPKGSAAEADAKALEIDYVTFSDIPLDDESAEMPVKITANGTANLPADAVVNATLVTDTAENQVIYDITILSGGQPVQPEEEVTVTIDVPQGMQAEYCKVYRLEGDGSKTNMKATLIDGKLVFTTDHFSLYSVEEVIYTPGDVNEDDDITLDDVVLIAQKVAGWDVTFNALAGDTNGDDNITLDDVVLLAQHVAGWNVNLGGGQTPTPPPADDGCNHIGCYFQSNGDGTHTAICDSCYEPLSKDNCTDNNSDGRCDDCNGLISGTGDVDINIGQNP